MLEIGYYSNIFPVKIEKEEIEILVTERRNFPDLRPLRDEIKDSKKKIFVYADGDRVFGYGAEADWLCSKGFSKIRINLRETPRLTGRMILEGFVEELKNKGYEPIPTKGRYEIFEFDKYNETSNGLIRVYKGFDIRSLFLRDIETRELFFGLVIDVTYSIKDKDGNCMGFYEIKNRYGSTTLKEVRQIQGDIIPTGINKEISRQRLKENILPFSQSVSKFNLPCGISAMLSEQPLRITLGGEDETLWRDIEETIS